MRISDLNANDQTNDSAPLGTVLRTVLSSPLFKYLRHGRILKLPSNISRWTRWQMISARVMEKQKKDYEYCLKHERCKRHSDATDIPDIPGNKYILRHQSAGLVVSFCVDRVLDDTFFVHAISISELRIPGLASNGQ